LLVFFDAPLFLPQWNKQDWIIRKHTHTPHTHTHTHTLDNSYCRSIYTPQRTYWIMFDSSAKNAMRKKWQKLMLGNDTAVINAQRHCSIWWHKKQKAKMHGNDTTVFNTQRHCSMLEVRLHANIPWSPPASTRNVDCWPPHHWQKKGKRHSGLQCTTALFLVLTSTWAWILDHKGCVEDKRARKTDMRTKIHGWILGYRSWHTQQRRHSLRTISFRLAASRTKATQLLQPKSRRTNWPPRKRRPRSNLNLTHMQNHWNK